MSRGHMDIFEPEESVGKLWHAVAGGEGAAPAHAGSAVHLAEIEGRLGVFFRGLGGAHDVDIRPAAPQASHHRLPWRRALGTWRERLARPSFDGEVLRLPEMIAEFPEREDNLALYFWLAAAAAQARNLPLRPDAPDDPLARDIAALSRAVSLTRATLAACPGLGRLYGRLLPACRAARPDHALPPHEQALEAAITHLLGGPLPDGERARAFLGLIRSPDADLSHLAAPRGYRPFRPVALWHDLGDAPRRAPVERLEEGREEGAGGSDEARQTKRARRSESDLAERRDSLILHRFEAILSWVESLNMNRRIEDDDQDTARRAAEDQDELALGQVSKKTATRLKFHLDLSPEDAERERISDICTYPEWDQRRGLYLPDHARVLASPAPEAEAPAAFTTDPAARRRIRAVRRQFEALRPRRVILPRQLDGEELDMEAAIASIVELRATGEGHDRVYRSARSQARDLAVSVLMDTSRSTESAIGDHQVIDVEREALAALAWGLDAVGDDFAIQTFSSLRRGRVFVLDVKRFDEKMGSATEARIAGLRPSFYTRLGAAIRHASRGLEARPNQHRLLLVVTDGKPNDLDHYEGRHGIEDSRMAVREARRKGQAVHGVIVDARGQAWFSRIFGEGGYSMVADPDRLIAALPEIYRQITKGA